MLKKKYFLSILLISLFFIGWGGEGHRILSKNVYSSFNGQMSYFMSWVDSLTAHASDADLRKSYVPGEEIKHYIDIDSYPEFVTNGYINQNIDSLYLQHGVSFVEDQGLLPWAILWALDSLKAGFLRRDFRAAMLHTADLGHYVADACMPLHITKNYNGQFTNQSGVHARFESNLISRYKAEIIYGGDSIEYIGNKSGFVFSLLYENYHYVDSLLSADSQAKALTGGTSSSAYYASMWTTSKPWTIGLFKRGSNALAKLLYSVWVDAGMPEPTTGTGNGNPIVQGFLLGQNYPNPFNPETFIVYSLGFRGYVTLKLYDVLGNEVATLVDEEKAAGSYEYKLSTPNLKLSSGVYFYRLQAGDFTATKKMVLLK